MSIKKLELNEESSLQDILSMGYLFLIALGIIKDAIFYYFLDINIIEYSGISDILLSPISFFSDGLRGVVAILATGLLFWGTIKYNPKIHRGLRTQKWYQMMVNVEKWDKKFAEPSNSFDIIKMCAIMLMCFFIGTGLGGGSKVSQRLKDKELIPSHEITFQNKEVKNVKIIGQNSQYIFYVLEGNNKVSITPIQGNVVKVERLEEVEK